jgi:hypothetical protein
MSALRLKADIADSAKHWCLTRTAATLLRKGERVVAQAHDESSVSRLCRSPHSLLCEYLFGWRDHRHQSEKGS